MKNLLLPIVFVLITGFSFAGEGSWSQRFLLNDVILNLDYTMVSPQSISEESHDYVSRVGLIHLDYTRKDHSNLETWNDWRIWITVDYKIEGSLNYIQKTIEINSEEGLYKFSDYIKFGISTNGYIAHISKVDGEYKNGSNSWISVSNPQYDSHFPVDIDFRLELREEKWYELGDRDTTPEFSNLWFDETTYRANWKYLQGAEQYDFEWVWIDTLSQEYADLHDAQTGISTSNPFSYELPFSLKEPSRVRVSHTHHTLDQTYSSGTLYFRVRAITKYTDNVLGAYDQVKEGEWMYFTHTQNYDFTNGTFHLTHLTSHEVIDGVDAFEKDKNWLYGVAYAEEGKSVSSVTFYDGSNRGRQSLTYNTSDNITLIGESKFDFEGRQTVSVVPAPVKGRNLGYHPLFNITQSGNEFSEADFDHSNYVGSPSVPLASVDPDPLNSDRELGAAQYFSGDNQFTDDLFRAAVPNANGFVYSQTVYRNDGTGRIEEVGGIGSTFQVGGDHTVKTYYGSTNKTELQRLFGSNASSNPQGYRKEMVKDANGQHSVTYYDKRGNVIATALSGESPTSLLELEDQDPVNIITSLNDNNIAVDPYTMISEHTHLNTIINSEIKLNYNVSGMVNQLVTTPVDVNGHIITLGDFCSTCRYDLKIEVISQQGDTISETSFNYGDSTFAPFHMSIDPSENCYDATTGAVVSLSGFNSTISQLSYILEDIGEYRIIKTLSVDQDAMQEAFDAQLELSGANDSTAFIADYISNIDISGCFTNCDDYCYWFKKFEYDQENGVGSWMALDTLIKLDSMAACTANVCDVNEMFWNFNSETAGADPIISPMEQACSGYRQQMIDQISPGGIFYDTQLSGFWAAVSANAPISVNGIDKTVAELQVSATFTADMAEALLPYHREYCHLQSCNEWAATMDYSNALNMEINQSSWPLVFNPPITSIYVSPHNPSPSLATPLLDYGVTGPMNPTTGDPFLDQDWNINFPASSMTLELAVDNYFLFLQSSTMGYTALPAPVSMLNMPFGYGNSGPLPLTFSVTDHRLFDYVNNVVNNTEFQNQSAGDSLTTDDYDLQKRLMFKGIYDQIKMELIKEYKSEVLGCVYQTDNNRVFIGPMTQSEMEQQIAGALSGTINSLSCADQAFVNTVYWIENIDATCLSNLSPSFHDLTFGDAPVSDEATLLNGSNATVDGLETIEQLFYDYVKATCSTNPLGLFFNPDVNDANFNALDSSSVVTQTASEPGEAEYMAIYSLLSNCSLPPAFETLPAPQSSILNVTSQNFPDCFLEYMQLINDGLIELNANPQPLTPCGNLNNVVACEEAQIDILTSGNYPYLTSVCGLTGIYKFYRSWFGDGTSYYEFGVDSGSCLFKLYIDGILQSNIAASTELISISNPVGSIGSINSNTDEIVSFDLNFADLSVGTAYILIDQTPCLFGDYTLSNQTITFGDFPDSLPDYQNDCIESTYGQAVIDAQIAYQNVLNDLQNQFQESMASCTESASENFTMSYELKEYQYTLYYYDLAGNLVQTVPPQGVHPIESSHFPLGVWDNIPVVHKMETRYKYNGLNTLIAQYTPDGGHSDFILDKLYRVRYSQNARQNDESKASYTKYDDLGRVREAGEFYIGASGPSAQLTLSDLEGLVEDNNFPDITRKMDYTVTYYEDIFPNDPSIQTAFKNGQNNLRNTIGAIEHFQTGEDGAITLQNAQAIYHTVISYSYDPHKNVEEMVSTNYSLAGLGQEHKTVRYDYDLISGNVNELIYQEGSFIESVDGEIVNELYSDEYRHKYHYDANNRLIRAFTSKDGGTTWDKEAKYFYYLHGALARTELGEDEIQGTDYAYNLQGWLKGVNASSLDVSRDLGHDAVGTGNNHYFGADAHGFMLSYFDNDYKALGQLPNAPVVVDAFADISGVTDNNTSLITGNTEPRNLFNGNIHNMVTALRDEVEIPMTVLSNNYQYDQLQRIRSMKVYNSPGDLGTGNHFDDAQLYNNGAYRTNYTFDKNGNLKTLDRYGDDGTNKMDEFAYSYYQDPNYNYTQPSGASNATDIVLTESNRLAQVSDNIITLDVDDPDVHHGQIARNYEYDASGQLKSDEQEGIEEIIWTVTGKVKEIKFTQASGTNDLKFVYDPMDMRIMKIEYLNPAKTAIEHTYYSCDAQGNVLATYKRLVQPPIVIFGDSLPDYDYDDVFSLSEHMVYGSSRLGVDNRNVELTRAEIRYPSGGNQDIEIAEDFVWSSVLDRNYSQSHRIVGQKFYELSNHLGNVLEVISDRKVGILDQGIYVYSADVVSYSDYYPYGMLLPGRHGSEANNDYRYGFQGQESDDEVKGKGNSVSYKYRMHDPRIGRFFAVDPLADKYPWYTPYQFCGNLVIYSSELEGLEPEKAPDGDYSELVKDGYTEVARNRCATPDGSVTNKWHVWHWVKDGSGFKFEIGAETQDPDFINKIVRDGNIKSLTNSFQFGDGNEFVSSDYQTANDAPDDVKGMANMMEAATTVMVTSLGLDALAIEQLGGLDAAQKMLADGKFQVSYNGKTKTYNLKFGGNGSVRTSLIKEAKTSFSALAKEGATQLKVVKGAGVILNFVGLAMTTNKLIGEAQSVDGVSAETTLDFMFALASFHPAGAVANGIYTFIGKPGAKLLYQKAIEMGATWDNYGLIDVE